jgi:hypothetical protein
MTMDPTANLSEQLKLARAIMKSVDNGADPCPMDSERLAELVIALNEWMWSGGFPPVQWRVPGALALASEMLAACKAAKLAIETSWFDRDGAVALEQSHKQLVAVITKVEENQ